MLKQIFELLSQDFTEKDFELLTASLLSDTSWKHTHNESVGEIEKKHPWREDTWHRADYVITHWQNLKHISHMSSPTPRHVWKIYRQNQVPIVTFRFGIAP